MLRLLGSHLLDKLLHKKQREKEMERSDLQTALDQVVITLALSVVGDVYSHPETATKHSSPNVNVTPTTTTLTTMGVICLLEAADSTYLGGDVSYTFTLSALIQ